MINRLQKKYALSVQGAKDLFKAIVYSVLANISLMLPVALLAIVLNTMLPMALGMEEKVAGFAGYTVVGIIILVIIFVLHYLQYTKAILVPMRKVNVDALHLQKSSGRYRLDFSMNVTLLI